MTSPLPGYVRPPTNPLTDFNRHFSKLYAQYGGQKGMLARGFTPTDLRAMQAPLRELQMNRSATEAQRYDALINALNTLHRRGMSINTSAQSAPAGGLSVAASPQPVAIPHPVAIPNTAPSSAPRGLTLGNNIIKLGQASGPEVVVTGRPMPEVPVMPMPAMPQSKDYGSPILETPPPPMPTYAAPPPPPPMPTLATGRSDAPMPMPTRVDETKWTQMTQPRVSTPEIMPSYDPAAEYRKFGTALASIIKGGGMTLQQANALKNPVFDAVRLGNTRAGYDAMQKALAAADQQAGRPILGIPNTPPVPSPQGMALGGLMAKYRGGAY